MNSISTLIILSFRETVKALCDPLVVPYSGKLGRLRCKFCGQCLYDYNLESHQSNSKNCKSKQTVALGFIKRVIKHNKTITRRTV